MSTHQNHHKRRSTTYAAKTGSTYWTQPRVSMPFMPTHRGSDLWTSKPGKRELWSYLTYALSTSNKSNKAVKIFALESTMENKRRYVGPTFHTPQEAKKYCMDNELAWPGDRQPLDLELIREEGLLKAWSRIWSPEVEQCLRASGESVERFVETFNIVGGALHVKVPKTFSDQLLLQIHREHGASNYLKYGRMGGYFFPDRPTSTIADDDEDEKDEKTTLAEMIIRPEVAAETPVHRRVYSFATVTVNTIDHKSLKFAFVRSRIKGDHYFVAVTPDFGDDELDQLQTYFGTDTSSYPDFDFDAKWMLVELSETNAATAGNRAALL